MKRTASRWIAAVSALATLGTIEGARRPHYGGTLRIEMRENEWIAWRSVEGSEIRNSGSVRFRRAPGARGTEVRVQLEYTPPAGSLGRAVAWMFGEEPDQQIHEDLHRFKQLMETGEIPLSDGPGLWRAAQPAANPDNLRNLAGVNR